MHAWIQTVVDILIVVMAAILVLFTLGLIFLHIITTTNNKKVEKIKKRIMRILSVSQDLEYLRDRIHQLLDQGGENMSLRDIRGIRSDRGTIAMTIVVDEVTPDQQKRLREIITGDEWYLAHIHRKMNSPDPDKVGIFTKLIAEMRLPGFETDVFRELYRWPSRADNQEIALLALFRCGCMKELIDLFSDKSFRLVISFRSLQELFAIFPGDKTSLYTQILSMECDTYITRACIRGIGIDGTEALCPRVAEFLTSENTNLLVDAIRTLGMLRYAPATEDVRAFTQHPSWIVRSVAATALSELAPDECYEDLLRCLCDSEWWVRFHAAEALADLKDHPALEDDVKGLSDRFAYDMIRFILERNALLKEAQAV